MDSWTTTIRSECFQSGAQISRAINIRQQRVKRCPDTGHVRSNELPRRRAQGRTTIKLITLACNPTRAANNRVID